MAKIKKGMTSDQVLRRLGKPAGPSEVLGEEDPTVIWPYDRWEFHFKYRRNAWRVVERHGTNPRR